jgi:ATP-dependent protease ClpP protease subunit
MPKTNRTVLTRNAYTMAVVDGKHAEMTLYGDIVESRPIDWWTDEPVEGNFIIQDEFLEDLETIKDAEDLTIHLNSCGGDAFVSLAIHNRLKELSAAGMDTTCIVDACAMSGGSLIMCACNHVKVNPSSLILIHDCWSFAWDRLNSTKLRKLADDLDVINESQAEIYAAKTGKDHDELRAMMQKETLMTGRKAYELGFADELIEDAADPDIEVSADHRTLFVQGRRMKFAAMGELPEGIRVHEEVETVPETDGGDNPKPEAEASAINKGGIPMTLEELRQSDPEAAEALIAEAQASVSHEEAVRAERQRIAEIDAVASLFDAETVNAAKYGENPCTAQEMTYRAAQEMAKTGKSFLNQMKAGYQEDGAGAVSSAPAPEEDAPMTSEERKAAGAAMAAKLRGEKTEEV